MLPYLNVTKKNSKKYTVQFRGINYGEGYTDGEFSDTENISLDEYPCVTPKSEYKTEDVGFQTNEDPQGLFGKDYLIAVVGESVYFKPEEKVWQKIGVEVSDTSKKFAAVGNYVIIYPDKIYLKIENKEYKEHGSMEVSETVPCTFESGAIVSEGHSWGFKAGDAVNVEGSDVAGNNATGEKTLVVREVQSGKLVFSANTFTEKTEATSVTITRRVPELDYICEANGRLFGTKGNTIYASAYNDPFNFYRYDDGSADDSYAITVTSGGEFTGCIAYTSHVCFFKEDCLHKLYGSKPSNFQVVTAHVPGVRDDCYRSLVNINETLYYMGMDGVYAYTGGMPELISSVFGNRRFSNASAGAFGHKYYINARESAYYHTFVFDTRDGTWVRERYDIKYLEFATCNGNLYLLEDPEYGFYDPESVTRVVKINRSKKDTSSEWSMTFCPFNETMNERKGYSKFHLRVDLDSGSWLRVEVKRDTDSKWQTVYTTHNERKRTITVPIIPARCDRVEIRLSGKGGFKLRTFIREFYVGSDV